MLCFDDLGQAIEVAPDTIQNRLAVYGVLVEDNQVLLVPHRSTNLWSLLGGIARPEETPQSALLRYMRVWAGITPAIGRLVLTDDRYWADESGQGWLLTCFYYKLRRQISGVSGLIDFENPANPQWVALEGLERKQLQFGYDAIQAALIHLNLEAATG